MSLCGGPAPPVLPGFWPVAGDGALTADGDGPTSGRMAGRSGPPEGWLYYFLRLPAGRNPLAEQYREAVRLRRALEGWLADNHVPRPLLDRAGQPLGELVSVVFRQDQPERVLAFRMFCNQLGVTEAMDHFRVVPGHCPRTTPPVSPPDAFPPLFRPVVR